MKKQSGKKQSGYKSYQYLEAGVDYKEFKLAREKDRLPAHQVLLTDKEEDRYHDFIRDHNIISLHDHPIIIPEDVNQLIPYEKEGREVTGFAALADSCLTAVFDNMMDGTCVINSSAGWKWVDVIHDIGMRNCDIDHQDFLIPGRDLGDIYRAKQEGRVVWYKALESSTMIENELDRIDILYGLGVRMMGITYSESNSLGSGLKEIRDGGLTAFGRKAVERMNKLGMAIDVSHSGNLTAMDTIRHSKKPVFITHTGARALWDINRLKPDEVLRACAERGGVIGIEAAPHTTITGNNLRHNLDSFMEHFEYIKDLVGIEHLAFGPDTLFGDHVGLHNMFSANMSIEESSGSDHEVVEYVEGLENPAEAMENIIRWLIKHNYSDEEIKLVTSQNIIRVLEQVWIQ